MNSVERLKQRFTEVKGHHVNVQVQFLLNETKMKREKEYKDKKKRIGLKSCLIDMTERH